MLYLFLAWILDFSFYQHILFHHSRSNLSLQAGWGLSRAGRAIAFSKNPTAAFEVYYPTRGGRHYLFIRQTPAQDSDLVIIHAWLYHP
jgi:hypothetical protein